MKGDHDGVMDMFRAVRKGEEVHGRPAPSGHDFATTSNKGVVVGGGPGEAAGGGGGSGGQRDLVIGLGTGITPDNLAVFAGSLRKVSPNSALVLFLDAPLPDRHKEIVNKYGITALEFSVDLLQPQYLAKYHPSNYRWPLLYRYLSKHASEYGKVLLADVRDSMFQKDPFAEFR